MNEEAKPEIRRKRSRRAGFWKVVALPALLAVALLLALSPEQRAFLWHSAPGLFERGAVPAMEVVPEARGIKEMPEARTENESTGDPHPGPLVHAEHGFAMTEARGNEVPEAEALKQMLARVEARLDQIASPPVEQPALPVAAEGERLARVEERLSALEALVGDKSLQREHGLLLALWQMRDALDRGQPLSFGLVAMKKMLMVAAGGAPMQYEPAGGAPTQYKSAGGASAARYQQMWDEVQALERQVRGAVPGGMELREEFSALAGPLSMALNQAEGGGAPSEMQQWLGDLVQIRRVAGEGDSVADGLIRRIETAVNAGRMEDALAPARALREQAVGGSAPVLERFLRWQEGLEVRAAAERHVGALFALLVLPEAGGVKEMPEAGGMKEMPEARGNDGGAT